jgi:hypothetical protein
MIFATQAAKEWSIGQGANGTGRREIVRGFFVVDTRSGRKVRAFTGKNAEAEAANWATQLEGMLANGNIR